MKRYLFPLAMLLLSACSEPTGPRYLYATSTPILIVAGMEADANLANAQATATELAKARAQATEEARQAVETRQAKATETYSAVTLEAVNRLATGTQVGIQQTLLAMTPTALAHQRAMATDTQQARIDKTKTAQQEQDDAAQRALAAAEQQRMRNEREASAQWWATFWGLAGVIAQVVVIAIGFVMVLACSIFCVYMYVYAQARLALEQARTFKAGLTRDALGNDWWFDTENRKWIRITETRPAIEPPDTSEPIPVYTGGKLTGHIERDTIRKGDEAKVAASLSLLRDVLAYMQMNPNWQITRLPGWRELCTLDPPDETQPKRWSGSRWKDAVAPLRRYLSSSGTAIHLSSQAKYGSWEELLSAIESARRFV